jgi:hypothetical protein
MLTRRQRAGAADRRLSNSAQCDAPQPRQQQSTCVLTLAEDYWLRVRALLF